ncbi:MAG: cytochrome c [Candidatus Sulfotelmatobacter sp.]
MRIALRKWSLLLGAAAIFALPLVSRAQVTTFQITSRDNTESHVDGYTGHVHAAQYDYRRYCEGCHGAMGDGNGEVAQWLTPPMWPKPRDFQLGIFECRSTPSGTLPVDSDLFDTIARGLDRSAMPIWNQFTKYQRANLVAYVKHFSPRFVSEKPGTPIVIPPEPEVTAERIKAGREVFGRVQCWKCHGVQGMANGPSAATLTTDLGFPIEPFNFTDGTRPKCGNTDADIYKDFMTGLDGTPMPSFADNIKPDEAWDLVFYLRTFMQQPSKAKDIAKTMHLMPVSANP